MQHCVTNAISVNSAADKSDRHCFGSCKTTSQLSHYYTVHTCRTKYYHAQRYTILHNTIIYYTSLIRFFYNFYYFLVQYYFVLYISSFCSSIVFHTPTVR